MRIEKITCDICGIETESVSIFPIKEGDVTKNFESCASCLFKINNAMSLLTLDVEINGTMYSLEALNLLLGKHCLGTPPQIKF